MPPGVKFQAISTERFMRTAAESALGYLRLALTVMVALGGAPYLAHTRFLLHENAS
jgi:hypothetical protein